MKVSIITVVFNGESHIEDCIQSVLSQKGVDLEYIVIDGGSNDNTLSIVKKYSGQIQKLISEPDKGIYDAMNKGINKTTGEIVGILNSDDLYAHENILKNVLLAFKGESYDLVYGDISFFSKDPSKLERVWVAGHQKSFYDAWHPPHPGLFVRKSVYEQYGSFDKQFRLAGDFEFMLRMFHRYELKAIYLPEVMVNMRLGGASTSSIKAVLDGMKEISRAFQINGEKIPFFYFSRRYFGKLLQLRPFKKNI